jgi:hypothetical protein
MNSSAERRAEVRFPTSCPAKMRILSPASPTVADVEVVNASMSGARIRTKEHIGVGMIVQVCFNKSILVAEVRNCAASGDGFEAGLYISVFYDRDDPSTHSWGTRVRRIVTPS